jgi:hypothetical protein
MSLAIIGKQSSCEFLWRRWALLRDTVDILVDPTRFPWFHAIGSPQRDQSRVPAVELARELDELACILRGRSTRALAVSPKTAAILYLALALPEPRPPSRFERTQVAAARAAGDLEAYFGSICESIREVCTQPLDDGTVEVLDV